MNPRCSSPEENEFLSLNFNVGTAWAGASDAEQEGVWKWVVGPEAGTVFWRGDVDGEAIGYHNWDGSEGRLGVTVHEDQPL